MLYESIQSEYIQLTQKIELIQKYISSLPNGKLLHKTCGKYIKWYRREDQKVSYIKKKDQKLLYELALKEYYLLHLNNSLTEKTILEKCLEQYTHHIANNEQLLNKTSYFRQFPTHFRNSSLFPTHDSSEDLFSWAYSPYEKNEKHPEHLTHESVAGHFLRSKSEAIIDLSLQYNKIPYRYEAATMLDGNKIFPDFTIRHPKTGEIFYWEHFGLMDDPSYCESVGKKIELYSKNGFIPSINLITTYETKDHPLTANEVNEIIKKYFL